MAAQAMIRHWTAPDVDLGDAEALPSALQLRPWLGNILLLEAVLPADLGRTDEPAV